MGQWAIGDGQWAMGHWVNGQWVNSQWGHWAIIIDNGCLSPLTFDLSPFTFHLCTLSKRSARQALTFDLSPLTFHLSPFTFAFLLLLFKFTPALLHA